MNKFPKSLRLIPGALIIAAGCLFLSGVSGCGPHHGDGGGDGGKPTINQDTLRNHVIPIDLAIQYTKAFRSVLDTNTWRIDPKQIDSLKLDRAEEFPADIFYDLLAQANPKQGQAKGIRIYLGRDPGGQLRMVLVPVDSLGNDIINHLVDQNGTSLPGGAKALKLTTDGGQGFEVGSVCPTACPNGSSGL
ncbi:MAG TPA: hypothetical protein VHE34_20420 [Puia sp.]|uniref:hypothetical protein n=1 Tax=Puia sp. TaxID=2045100 RepID=UPI002BBBF1CA|nr:hypothetical protein [Puia sp.]HVU97606.1 hypothetical protein [Puia sp.]